jgi:hypothetical protein
MTDVVKPVSKYDPLLDDPTIPVEASTFLHCYDETSDSHLALDNIWKKHGIRVSFQRVNGWRRTIPAFAEAYDTLRLIMAGRMKQQFGNRAADKLTGGQATYYAMQLNRLAPEEYVPAIVTQTHATITYKVEGGFEPLPTEGVKEKDKENGNGKRIDDSRS